MERRPIWIRRASAGASAGKAKENEGKYRQESRRRVLNSILGTLSEGVSDFVGRRRPGGFGWGGWKDSGGAHWRLACTKPLVLERRDLVDRGDGLETSALKAACTRMKKSRVRRSGRQIGAARRAGADGQSLENCEAWKFMMWGRGGDTRTEIAYRVSVGESCYKGREKVFLWRKLRTRSAYTKLRTQVEVGDQGTTRLGGSAKAL